MLTEAEVQKNFSRLFSSTEITVDTFEKAELLIDQLRHESPLRHRLSEQLEEIRKLQPAE